MLQRMFLDKFDHLGNVRAGVEVLRGDATTFNAVCDASPHLWKYTSGVIAWSKDDAPTNEQIKRVLNDFEEHAFSGLDPSQYHLLLCYTLTMMDQSTFTF